MQRSIGGESELTSEPVTSIFRNHVAFADLYAVMQPDQRAALWGEAFEAGQLARATGTAAAVSRMAARFATGGGALARAVREQQKLVARWRDLDAALDAAVSRPPEERNGILRSGCSRSVPRSIAGSTSWTGS